jgi:hypothetical protein
LPDFQTLSLRSGKNTFSNLLKGKLLIVENVQQLIMTAFSAGVPSVTTEDDVVSSCRIFCTILKNLFSAECHKNFTL